MNNRRFEHSSSFLQGQTLKKVLRLILCMVVWSLLAGQGPGSLAFGQAVNYCCEPGDFSFLRCSTNFDPYPGVSTEQECEAEGGSYVSDPFTEYACIDDKCCPTTKVCGFGDTQDCCTEAETCIKRKCCPAGTPQACAGVCCAAGETQCDAQQRCCKPNATFQISAVRSGPPAQMDITVHNPEDGIGTITPRKLVNATMNTPTFPAGTRNPVKVTVTKIDPAKPAQVVLTTCSPDGCCQDGDPVLAVLKVARDKDRAREVFRQIPAAEHFISIQNGRFGLERLHVFINGRRVRILDLSPREVQTIDVAEYMVAGQNTVMLTGQGPSGSNGLVFISDIPGFGSTLGASISSQALRDFDDLPEALDMHWGN